MIDRPPYPDTDEGGAGPDRGSPSTYPGTPRWVKVSGIIALVLVLLFLGLHLAGGGQMPFMQHGVQRP